MSSTRIRLVATAFAALPLVPVGLYTLDTSTAYVALSLVSVLIVAASLFLMFGSDESAGADPV